MRNRSSLVIGLIGLLSALVVVTQPLFAQECTALVQEQFAALETLCQDVGGATVCFGGAASATTSDGSTQAMSEAGATLPLADISRVTTAAIDPEAEAFGLALMNVHANVPLGLSEQGLHYLMVGDVQVENRVDPAQAVVPGEPVTVTALVGSNLRATPSTEGRIVSSAAAGTELIASGLSPDRQWVIVIFEGTNVWVSRSVLGVVEGDLDSLPVWTNDTRTLMQSFQLSTGVGVPECIGTPLSMLIVQGPPDFNALIEVNGVEIRFSGTIGLWLTENNEMQLTVFSGGASSNNLPLPAGFTMVMTLGEDGLSAGNPWRNVRPISGDERALLSTTMTMPDGMLYTPLSLPTEAEVSQTLASLNQAAASGPAQVTGSGEGIDCSSFRPTSPLTGMPNASDVPFFWDGAPGATSYQLVFFNDGGEQLAAFDVAAVNTTLVTNTSALPGGPTFGWEVRAFVNGELACTTSRVVVQREAAQQGVESGGDAQPTPTACPWSEC